MDDISAKYGKPLAQIALNWSTQKDYVSTALCGVKSEEEADENLATFDWMLEKEDLEILDKAVEQYLDFDGSARMK